METLYDKMLLAVKSPNTLFESTEKDEMEIAKACTNLAIEAQIDLLGKQNERLEKQKKSLKETLDFVMGTRSDVINGKIEGIKLAIENNRQEIQELKRQLEP